jgi:predicted transposase/invertase (TIGR01784 family)
MPKFRKGEEALETHFDKWMYALKNLPRLQERPRRLQEQVFEKLFAQAEIAKLNREDMNAYEQSLKIYRDNKNTMDYMKKEGKEEGRAEGKEEAMLAVARRLKEKGIDLETITETTGLTKEQIEKL